MMTQAITKLSKSKKKSIKTTMTWYAIDADTLRDYNTNMSPCIGVYYANEDGYVAEYAGLKPNLLPNNSQFKLNQKQVHLVKHCLHLEGRSNKVVFFNTHTYHVSNNTIKNVR